MILDLYGSFSLIPLVYEGHQQFVVCGMFAVYYLWMQLAVDVKFNLVEKLYELLLPVIYAFYLFQDNLFDQKTYLPLMVVSIYTAIPMTYCYFVLLFKVIRLI